MGLKKGSKINRKSLLRDEIKELLFCSPHFLSVVDVRDHILEKKAYLLNNCKHLSSKTNVIRSILLRLEKNDFLKSEFFQIKKSDRTRKNCKEFKKVRKFKYNIN